MIGSDINQRQRLLTTPEAENASRLCSNSTWPIRRSSACRVTDEVTVDFNGRVYISVEAIIQNGAVNFGSRIRTVFLYGNIAYNNCSSACIIMVVQRRKIYLNYKNVCNARHFVDTFGVALIF